MHGGPPLNRSISARSVIRLRFNRREHQDRENRGWRRRSRQQGVDAYGRDVLNENGKLLLGFAKDKRLALLNNFFCTPKSGVAYTFRSANRSKEETRLDYILTKQEDRRLICCVNVRQPPLDASESDHNLVYAKVRIPHRSASHAGPHQAGGRGALPRKLRSWPTLDG